MEATGEKIGKETQALIDNPNDPKARKAFLMDMFKLLMSCCQGADAAAAKGGSRRSSKAKQTEEKKEEPKAADPPAEKSWGKLGKLKPPDAEINEVFESVRELILEKINEKTGLQPNKLEVLGYRIQTVLGIKYFTKVKIDDGPTAIHAKIFSPVEGEPCLSDVSEIKNENDEIIYF